MTLPEAVKYTCIRLVGLNIASQATTKQNFLWLVVMKTIAERAQ